MTTANNNGQTTAVNTDVNVLESLMGDMADGFISGATEQSAEEVKLRKEINELEKGFQIELKNIRRGKTEAVALVAKPFNEKEKALKESHKEKIEALKEQLNPKKENPLAKYFTAEATDQAGVKVADKVADVIESTPVNSVLSGFSRLKKRLSK